MARMPKPRIAAVLSCLRRWYDSRVDHDDGDDDERVYGVELDAFRGGNANCMVSTKERIVPSEGLLGDLEG